MCISDSIDYSNVYIPHSARCVHVGSAKPTYTEHCPKMANSPSTKRPAWKSVEMFRGKSAFNMVMQLLDHELAWGSEVK